MCKILKNQTYFKESINNIIVYYSTISSHVFMKKLFTSIQDNIISEEYLHGDIYYLLNSCLVSSRYFSKKDEIINAIVG